MITEQQCLEPYDFLISDFVYEAFEIGNLSSIPTFGVAHFTWDWFLASYILHQYKQKCWIIYFFYQKATRIYFPPFTPKEILKHYKNAVSVPLIVRNQRINQIKFNDENFKVLIIDSGSGL